MSQVWKRAMLLEIPFLYEAKVDYRPHRKDDLHAIHCRDLRLGTTEIEIPEVSEEEAPLVITARGVGSMQDDVQHVRYHDGGFYYANGKSIGHGGIIITGEMLRRGAGHFTATRGNQHPVLAAYRRNVRDERYTDGQSGIVAWLSGDKLVIPKGETVWERKDEGLAVALSAIDPMIIIDGEVWVRGFEPTIVVSIVVENYRDVRARLDLSAEQHLGQRYFGVGDRRKKSVETPNRTQVFSVTDVAQALDAANRLGLPRETAASFTELAIQLPDVLRFDASESHIARTASQYLALLAEDLSGQTDQSVREWLEMRGVLHSIQDGELGATSLLRELGRLARQPRADKIMKELRSALEFYDDMPINVVQVPAAASPAPRA